MLKQQLYPDLRISTYSWGHTTSSLRHPRAHKCDSLGIPRGAPSMVKRQVKKRHSNTKALVLRWQCAGVMVGDGYQESFRESSEMKLLVWIAGRSSATFITF